MSRAAHFRRGNMHMQTHNMYIPNAKKLEELCPLVAKRGATPEIRMQRTIKHTIKLRKARIAEREIVQLPYGLFDFERKRVNKKVVYMTEDESRIRNATLRDLKMCWCRIGYQ